MKETSREGHPHAPEYPSLDPIERTKHCGMTTRTIDIGMQQLNGNVRQQQWSGGKFSMINLKSCQPIFNLE